MDQRPKVGVGVLVFKEKKILLGFRKSSHGAGAWQFPGGHLEFKETLEACASREVAEEVGIQIKNIHCGPYTNDIFEEEGKHYITLFMIAEFDIGEVTINEPTKSERWDWFDLNQLPSPLFLPVRNLLNQYPTIESLLKYNLS